MNEQDAFAGRLKQRFDDSVRDVDPKTAACIARCHERALAGTGHSPSTMLWLPAGAVATACLALLVYALLPEPASQQAPQPATVIEQMELITDLELYEDLEFYRWLEQHELPS